MQSVVYVSSAPCAIHTLPARISQCLELRNSQSTIPLRVVLYQHVVLSNGMFLGPPYTYGIILNICQVFFVHSNI